METINYVNLFGIVAGIGAVVYMAMLIVPSIKEMQRPKNGFSLLRRRLFVEVIIIILLMVLRVPYFMNTINAEYADLWRSVVSIATSSALFYFAYNKYKTFTYKETKEE